MRCNFNCAPRCHGPPAHRSVSSTVWDMPGTGRQMPFCVVAAPAGWVTPGHAPALSHTCAIACMETPALDFACQPPHHHSAVGSPLRLGDPPTYAWVCTGALCALVAPATATQPSQQPCGCAASNAMRCEPCAGSYAQRQRL